MSKPLSAQFMDLMLEASHKWAEMAARRKAADEAVFRSVVADAKAMLERGETMEDIVTMVKEAYEPEEYSADPERD